MTAFAYKDYVSFGYVYVGLRGVEEMTRQYNVNLYTPTMLIFKEHINKPADVIQVCEPPQAETVFLLPQPSHKYALQGSGVQEHMSLWIA